jgi:sugar phosphate isomerase/epimerase
MHIAGVCINADGEHLGGSLAQLAADLRLFRQCGYDGVELSLHGLDVVSGGRVQHGQLARVRAIVTDFPFAYTVHGPDQVNLAFPQKGRGSESGSTMDRDVFLASLDCCAALGAPVMVYHSGLMALAAAAAGLEPLPGDDELERAREREVAGLRELMPLAAERGVVVAMENRDPHPWEIAALRHFGLPPEQLVKYHAGMSIPSLVAQVEGVGHPNLGLTLDFGHLFLAANHMGFDFLDAIRLAAPYVRHLHVSDNWGRLGGAYDSLNHRIPFGEGDVHMPPGWGAVPHVEALKQLADYEGFFVLEIRPRFHEHLAAGLEAMRHIVQQAAA